jgi:NADH:ubiquinone oxidoreductase subunit 6 (subunit J)
MTLAMLRDDWWWPWWVSSLIDLGVVAIATAVFFASSRRSVKVIAGVFVLAGLIAAVMAPIVMTEDSDEPSMGSTMRP